MMRLVWVIASIAAAMQTAVAFSEGECPVCYRVVRAARKLGGSSKTAGAEAFQKYCMLENLAVDELKFCYDVDSFKQDIIKLFNFGADENRICKKVHSINLNFCAVKKKDAVLPGTRAFKNARGVIYE